MISNAIDELLLHGFHRLPSPLVWRLNDWALRRVRAHGRQLVPRVVRCRGDFRLLVDPADWIGSHIALRREFEPGLGCIIKRFLKPGDHFLDVGANIGYFSLLAAGIVGASGYVSAIEASPITRQSLFRNLQFNRLDARIRIHDLAVWDSETELTFHQGPLENSGLSGLAESHRSVASFKVRAGTLDSAVPFRQRPVSFAKLDVEGAEYHALMGMKEIIAQRRPVIALELSPAFLGRFGHSPRDVLDFLVREHEYACYGYDSRGELRAADLAALCDEKGEQENLLFMPGER